MSSPFPEGPPPWALGPLIVGGMVGVVYLLAVLWQYADGAEQTTWSTAVPAASTRLAQYVAKDTQLKQLKKHRFEWGHQPVAYVDTYEQAMALVNKCRTQGAVAGLGDG